MQTIVFDEIHRGPFDAANGGYVAGVLGDAAGGSASATRLQQPVPTGEPLDLLSDEGRVVLRHGDRALAETLRVRTPVAEAGFVPIDEATAAPAPRFDMGIFADCFVCGRQGPDGLGIRPRPLDDGRFVAVWHPAASGMIDGPKVPARYLRSALDCPGGFAAIAASRQLAVTGSLTTRIEYLPEAEQSLIVVGQPAGSEGRKLSAITTIFTESNDIVATAEAIWVALQPLPADWAA
jgi:hypothetical protein